MELDTLDLFAALDLKLHPVPNSASDLRFYGPDMLDLVPALHVFHAHHAELSTRQGLKPCQRNGLRAFLA